MWYDGVYAIVWVRQCKGYVLIGIERVSFKNQGLSLAKQLS